MNQSSSSSHAKDIEDPILIDIADDLATITSSSTLPPGSRVRFQLSCKASPEPLLLSGKVVSISPAPTGEKRFRLGIRLHSLTREQSRALSGK